MTTNNLLVMMNNKPRVLKDYGKLDETVKQLIKLNYPNGFEDYLIRFQNKEGNNVSALPFETDDCYYLIRMTISQAQEIIDEDDDYDDDGFLKDEIREEYKENFDEEQEQEQEHKHEHEHEDEDEEDNDDFE